MPNNITKLFLLTVFAALSSVMPGIPYGTHYLIDAMLLYGMAQQAKDHMLEYWGGMVRKGADTFWEAYDIEDDFISPNHFLPMNSYCHAWSCTPYILHLCLSGNIPNEKYTLNTIGFRTKIIC